MAFNIGISASGYENDQDCYIFIDPEYYTFVASYHRFGNDSALIQVGRFFGLDVMPLTQLVYTWDEVTEDVIEENLQDLSTLYTLVQNLHDHIVRDADVINKIHYRAYDDLSFPDEALADSNINPYDDVRGIIEKLVQDRYLAREREQNDPNPWKEYFDTKKVLTDLQSVLKGLAVFRDKGVDRVYFDVG